MADSGKRRAIGLVIVAGLLGSTLSFGQFLVPARAQGATCDRDVSWGTVRVQWTREVVELTNQHRAEMGLNELSASRPLTRSAVWKSAHMAGFEYLEHDDPAPPEERSWEERIEDCGYFGGVGENIAYGYRNPEAVMEGWLNSPGHRANIERESYVTIGVGVVTNADGTTYWTQNFGSADTSQDDVQTPPTPRDDTIEMLEDAVADFAPLANDVDPDGDPIEIVDETEPLHGELGIAIDGAASYRPARDFFGTDSITYTVMDIFGFSATATITVNIAPVNDRPEATGESKKVRAGRTVRIRVLVNDFDVDGDALRLDGILKAPRRGELVDVDQTSGIITYRPAPGAGGRRDRIVYRVSDGNGGSDRATVRLKIRR